MVVQCQSGPSTVIRTSSFSELSMRREQYQIQEQGRDEQYWLDDETRYTMVRRPDEPQELLNAPSR